MKQNLQKRICAAFFFLCAGARFLPAVPGIQSPLPDISGSYVYYRDYSFDWDVYIGFLQYDEHSYAMRYYAPAAEQPGAAASPRSVEILFTMDAAKGVPEMTGERILSHVSEPDIIIVNYLHDLVYEFSARRSRIDSAAFEKAVKNAFKPLRPKTLEKGVVTSEEDFRQFGGDVVMRYDFYIPVFNLRDIQDSSGGILFELVTAGVMTDSSDQSFFSFSGMDENASDKERSFAFAPDPGILELKDTSQILKLDDQWKMAGPGIWMLGDAAILSFSALPQNGIQAKIGKEVLLSAYMLRSMLLGASEGAYPDWLNMDIKTGKKRFTVENRYHLADGSVSHSFRQYDTAGDAVCMFSLTVFDAVYKENTPYFNAIIKNYRCK